MNDLLDLIRATILSGVTSLTVTKIDVGQLPQKGGISVEIAPSPTDRTFLTKSRTGSLDLLIMRKSRDQALCISELDSIGEYLSKLKVYPSTANIQWVNSEVTTDVNMVSKEENGPYIYAMVISNSIFR